MLNITPNRYGRSFAEWTADELKEHRERKRGYAFIRVVYHDERGRCRFEDIQAPTLKIAHHQLPSTCRQIARWSGQLVRFDFYRFRNDPRDCERWTVKYSPLPHENTMHITK